MSVRYRWVQWNRHKLVYDATVLGGIVLFLGAFVVVGSAVFPGEQALSGPILLLRALGVTALLLLHIVLAIGPLARLDRRFLPLLYNRRHLGVMLFFIALGHAALVVLFYGGFGNRNPVLAVLAPDRALSWPSGLPYEFFGFVALLILFAMAATSHDFWLKHLSARVWKSLHMLVYVAYVLLIAHVVFGAMQSERSVLYPVLLGAGVIGLGTLHLLAGLREVARSPNPTSHRGDALDGWLDAGRVDAIGDGRATVVCPASGERIAVFRDGEAYSAVSNVCAHQGGPLGEGAIVDGCITCPWHGYQYRASDGQSPPPYTEKIPTYEVRIAGERVYVNPRANAPGTPVEPARLGASTEREERDDA
jgi:nitrite reductase/ring-hydroxylating ferredoxin subunit/DMSO/TMAO reductase YedYZ heme-binding membrane subunit